MKVNAEFEIKQYNPRWSNQECNTVMPDGAKFTFCCKGKVCLIQIDSTTEDRAMQLLYAIFELLCLYDGYFYKPIRFFIDEQEKSVQERFKLNKYTTANKWISGATLLGRNERDLSSIIIQKYIELFSQDRKEKSMNRSMISSYYYLKSDAYSNINIEHLLALLMCVCDGASIQFLEGNIKNNTGNIEKLIGSLDRQKFKHGAEMLDIPTSKAVKAVGNTRNELIHFSYKENSLGSYISNPDFQTDEAANLYVFYILDVALRIALLETVGYQVKDDVRTYAIDEVLDWIKLVKQIEEDCAIPVNQLRQILQKLQKGDVIGASEE